MWATVGKVLIQVAMWCSQHPEVIQAAEDAVKKAKDGKSA
jgi:hypothetical protein